MQLQIYSFAPGLGHKIKSGKGREGGGSNIVGHRQSKLDDDDDDDDDGGGDGDGIVVLLCLCLCELPSYTTLDSTFGQL